MKDLVTFEVAKKLKEKGFMEKVVYYYDEKGKVNVYKSYAIGNIEHSWLDFRIIRNMCKSSPWCDAPTISQVLKWLRDKKELHIEIYMYHNYYLWEIYNTKIYDVDFTQKREKYSEIEYATYEQATLAGIEYVLDNLIG